MYAPIWKAKAAKMKGLQKIIYERLCCVCVDILEDQYGIGDQLQLNKLEADLENSIKSLNKLPEEKKG